MTKRVCLFLSFIAFSSAALAGNNSSSQGDHPLVSRFTDSHITQYSQTDYDEYLLATGIALPGSKTPPTKSLEGKITTIIYETNTDRSSVLQVTRSFERFLNDSGFSPLFSCSNKECGHKLIPNLFGNSVRHGQYLKFDVYNTNPGNANFNYITRYKKINNTIVYVSLIIKTHTFMKAPVKIALDVIETGALEIQTASALSQVKPSNKVIPASSSIQTTINQYGRVVLDGIYFDSNQAVIKDKSHAALKRIADYLNTTNPEQVHIVGHTDSTGDYDTNMKLSRKLARAVARQLYINYFVRKSQLKPVGVANVAPISSNNTAQGRAKNRRLELVLTEA